MQGENFLETDLVSADLIGGRSSSNKKIIWIGLHALALLAGVGLLVGLIYKVGYATILESVTRVGWGFGIIIFLNIARHFARAASMYLAVEPSKRVFKYRSAVAARMGGEAVSFFTFTGPFLGDATKAVLLKKSLPLAYGASAVIIDNILYYFSVIFIILTGVALLLVEVGSSGSTMNRVLLGIVIGCLVMFVAMSLTLLYSVKPLTRIIEMFERRGLAPAFVVKRKAGFQRIETNVFQFYQTRRADFFKVFFISVGVHALSVAEVYFALRLLGFEAHFTTAFIVESLTKVINAVFSFIPGVIGVYEGGNGIILKTLGFDVGVGISLALVRRGAILLSTLIGIIILLWRTAEHGAEQYEARE